MPFDAPRFRYVRKKGRPKNPDGAARIVFTVAALVARFDLNIYRNDQQSAYGNTPAPVCACDVIAEANVRLYFVPSSYSGVRSALERDSGSDLIREDGTLRGRYDKKSVI